MTRANGFTMHSTAPKRLHLFGTSLKPATTTCPSLTHKTQRPVVMCHKWRVSRTYIGTCSDILEHRIEKRYQCRRFNRGHRTSSSRNRGAAWQQPGSSPQQFQGTAPMASTGAVISMRPSLSDNCQIYAKLAKTLHATMLTTPSPRQPPGTITTHQSFQAWTRTLAKTLRLEGRFACGMKTYTVTRISGWKTVCGVSVGSSAKTTGCTSCMRA